MKEAAPRIFRSLETPRGQAGFDTIVAAAVAAYGSLRSPTEAQSRDFGRLVAPLWARTEPETRRALSASLSHTPRMPRELVDLLIAAPIEISAPFLVSTPTLTPADVQRLEALGDERLARILVGREQRGLTGTAPAPHRLQIDAPPLAPELLGEPSQSQPANAGTEAAALVRETLRRLARTGRAAPSGEATIGEILLDAARDADAPAFFDTLAARLDLSNGERGRIEADLGGLALARILKGLRLGTGDALGILMLVRPSIGLDVRAFEAMTNYYRSLSGRDCRESFSPSAPGPENARDRAVRGREARPETPVRASFGRRQEKPAEGRKQSGQ